MKRLINLFINIFRVLTLFITTDMNDFHADFNFILFLFLYRKLDAEREGKKKELSKHIPGPLQGQ